MKNYFKKENIFLNFDANDRKDFFSKISKILFEKKYVKEGFNDSIIEREEKYPTGCYGSIADLSTAQHNYLRDGYWAKTKADELPPKRLFVRFFVRMDNVTDRMQIGRAHV